MRLIYVGQEDKGLSRIAQIKTGIEVEMYGHGE